MLQALVVDDDQDSCDALRLVLEDAGYAVAEAANGLQALAALRASAAPMVAVLDLDLPELDGLSVVRAVTEDERLAARTALVLVTAVAHDHYQAAEDVCERLGVPFLLKPYDLDVLLGAVALAVCRLPPPQP